MAARQLRSQAAKVGRHCYADNETDSDAKMPRGIDAKSITGITESILAPMAGEESSSLRTVVSIRNAGAGENQNEIIQSYPSPEFLNSLPFIKKFYPLPVGARVS